VGAEEDIVSEQRWQKVGEKELTEFQEAPQTWLAAQMSPEMPWLLVHADDGVIWGWLKPDGILVLSSDIAEIRAKHPAIGVVLRVETVQQVRVFGPGGELLMWRDGAGFCGRRIMDGGAVPEGAWEESHILWGTRVAGSAEFTVLQEGQQGPVHAVPLPVTGGSRAALTVRQYVERVDQYQAAVTLSRLVRLGLYEPQRGG
jgi:CRISPR-associated protein (TIGR03984 family)